MGVVIYPVADLMIENLSPEHKAQIEQDNVFVVDDQEIHFSFESFESMCPLDGVQQSLERLVNYAEENGLSVSGSVQIESDWSDYDNILIDIHDNDILFANTEIRNASSEELIEELRRRGYTIEVPQEEMEL